MDTGKTRSKARTPPPPEVPAALKETKGQNSEVSYDIKRIDELAKILGLHEDENWRTFKNHPSLNDTARMQYIRDIIMGGLEEILYNEPKLLQWYSKNYLTLSHD